MRICNRYTTVNDLSSMADNKIIGTALKLNEEAGTHVTILTTDGNMRNVARAYGLRAETYPFLPNDSQAETKVAPVASLKWNIVAALICAILVLVFIIHNTP